MNRFNLSVRSVRVTAPCSVSDEFVVEHRPAAEELVAAHLKQLDGELRALGTGFELEVFE